MNVIDTNICACGSGLRRSRCCELDRAALATPAAMKQLMPFVEQAQAAVQAGNLVRAEELCRDVLDLAPSHTEALAVLYSVCNATGRNNAAEMLARRVVALNPNNLWAINELALRLLSKGDLGEAEHHARNAVRIAPENPQAHNLMGMILTEANRPKVGEYHYRRVLALTGKPDGVLLANLAWNLKSQGRMAEARALYEQSVALAPEVLQTLLGWARLEEADRNFDACKRLLDRAEAIAPNAPNVKLARAILHGRKHEPKNALAIIDSLEADNGNAMLGGNELLEKGRLLDQIGKTRSAFAAFTEGKRRIRERSGKSYMAESAQQMAGRLKDFFNANRMNILPRAGVRTDVPQPVFILGFPRSGTTLVEQTLSAHSRIVAGDELPFIGEVANSMARLLNSPLAYPEALCELWFGDRRHELDNLRDYYLQHVQQLGILEEGTAWFTDKMPLNEMHLGLISLLFPQAPLIHVIRHPLDVILSVFSNHLTHGFFCAFDLESAARHYVQTMDLVEHYRSELVLRYLPIRYEDIVDNQETSVRRMLDFIGEPYDERCLRFHENRRYARTASYAQVTEKLYDRSRYRYRRYMYDLEPVVPLLEPIINRLGYEV